MTNRAQALLREALTLAAEERADVAAELLASLDGPRNGPVRRRSGVGDREESKSEPAA